MVTDLLLWIPLQICKPVQEMNTRELHPRQNPVMHVHVQCIWTTTCMKVIPEISKAHVYSGLSE